MIHLAMKQTNLTYIVDILSLVTSLDLWGGGGVKSQDTNPKARIANVLKSDGSTTKKGTFQPFKTLTDHLIPSPHQKVHFTVYIGSILAQKD